MEPSTSAVLLWPFLVYGIAVVTLVGGILFISYFLGERHEENATDQAYEAGITATGTARLRFPVHFYIIAMFFVIFDVQSVFVICWAISIRAVGLAGYIGIVIFIGVLVAVLVYERQIGALDFGPDGKKILKSYHQKIKTPIRNEMVDKQGQ